MNFNTKKPIYIQIADYFLDSIISKKYNVGDRIMSVRDLAVELEVNPNTVMRSYNYLQDKDIVFNKRGIGYFIGKNALKNAKKIKYKEFTQEELPDIFNTMRILEIDIEQLKELYDNYKIKTDETFMTKNLDIQDND